MTLRHSTPQQRESEACSASAGKTSSPMYHTEQQCRNSFCNPFATTSLMATRQPIRGMQPTKRTTRPLIRYGTAHSAAYIRHSKKKLLQRMEPQRPRYSHAVHTRAVHILYMSTLPNIAAHQAAAPKVMHIQRVRGQMIRDGYTTHTQKHCGA